MSWVYWLAILIEHHSFSLHRVVDTQSQIIFMTLNRNPYLFIVWLTSFSLKRNSQKYLPFMGAWNSFWVSFVIRLHIGGESDLPNTPKKLLSDAGTKVSPPKLMPSFKTFFPFKTLWRCTFQTRGTYSGKRLDEIFNRKLGHMLIKSCRQSTICLASLHQP